MREYYLWLLKAYIEFQREHLIDALAYTPTRYPQHALIRKRRKYGKWDSRFKAELTRIENSLPFQQ